MYSLFKQAGHDVIQCVISESSTHTPLARELSYKKVTELEANKRNFSAWEREK